MKTDPGKGSIHSHQDLISLANQADHAGNKGLANYLHDAAMRAPTDAQIDGYDMDCDVAAEDAGGGEGGFEDPGCGVFE